MWDWVLRLTLVGVAAAIPLTLWVPETGGWVAFALVTIWVNGPIAPFLPSTYEPILVLVGRVLDPFWVAVVGTAGTIYSEYLNYYLYRRVLRMDALSRARESRLSAWVLKRFKVAPFFTVWLCSWSILPYWPVRFISPLAGYDVRKQMLATALGRFPRIWFFAALGSVLAIETKVLAIWSASLVLIVVTIFAIARWRAARRGAPTPPELAAIEPAEG